MTDSHPLNNLLREMMLAVAMIAFLVLGLWAHTGTMPPLVVVESSSMIHEENGEVGSIDAGDLILVMDTPYDNIVTFAEASDRQNNHFGYKTHGMEGDVIIYERNGESSSTPIIHRALFKAEIGSSTDAVQGECESGTKWNNLCILSWTVPGSDQIEVERINLVFDGDKVGKYSCAGVAAQHGSEWYSVENYTPINPGYITLGDNNDCNDDQGVFEFAQGLSSLHSGIIKPVQDDWVIGVSGAEIPWLGTVKLMVSGGNSPGVSQVPGLSFIFLFVFIGVVLLTPVIVDPLFNRILKNSPEMLEAEKEAEIAKIYSSEEE